MGTANGFDAGEMFTALAHPIRRQILRTLLSRRAERSPSELSGELGHPLGRLSYHFGILVSCRAIELTATRPAHGSTEHFYRPTVEAAWARKALRVTAPGAEG